MSELLDAVRALMREANKSLRATSSEAGYPPSSVSAALTGKTTIRAEMLQDLLQVLGVPQGEQGAWIERRATLVSGNGGVTKTSSHGLMGKWRIVLIASALLVALALISAAVSVWGRDSAGPPSASLDPGVVGGVDHPKATPSQSALAPHRSRPPAGGSPEIDASVGGAALDSPGAPVHFYPDSDWPTGYMLKRGALISIECRTSDGTKLMDDHGREIKGAGTEWYRLGKSIWIHSYYTSLTRERASSHSRAIPECTEGLKAPRLRQSTEPPRSIIVWTLDELKRLISESRPLAAANPGPLTGPTSPSPSPTSMGLIEQIIGQVDKVLPQASRRSPGERPEQ